jgi:fructosamine-3-kinase
MMKTSLPEGLHAAVLRTLEEQLGGSVAIEATENLTGGCIHRVLRLRTNQGDFCLKYNPDPAAGAMFRTEAQDLQLLREARAIRIPAVLAETVSEAGEFLLMEYLAPGRQQRDYWPVFGEQLAALHSQSTEQFGLDYDNYIGSLPQYNTQRSPNWPEFFRTQRLLPQIEWARAKNLLDRQTNQGLDQCLARLEALFPEERPALIHGDLWQGNVMTGPNGQVALIDPAVYYGHREIELAFSRLFGGFPREFYSRYEQALPLTPGFEERIDYYNLYPLLVHVNIFGRSYVSDVAQIVRPFVPKG